MVTIPNTHSPEITLEEIRELFEDDHVRMALIVASSGHLITTIERSDLNVASGTRAASTLGTLVDRTVAPSQSLAAATAALKRKCKRRLAVVEDSGRLVGLLCLRRDGNGFCSVGIRRRVKEAVERATGSRRPTSPANACQRVSIAPIRRNHGSRQRHPLAGDGDRP